MTTPQPRADSMKTVGAELITSERNRQIRDERWSFRHDDGHTENELTFAAITYALEGTGIGGKEFWPWDDDYWKPTSRIRNLVKAGALIAAEIDRLYRAT